MDVLVASFAYVQAHPAEFGEALRTHFLLSGLALGVAILSCVPLGLLTTRRGGAARLLPNAVAVPRVVPRTAALFWLLIPCNDRARVTWELSEELHRIANPNEPHESRLRRSVAVVTRR